jgi:hypothetical protein
MKPYVKSSMHSSEELSLKHLLWVETRSIAMLDQHGGI